MKKILVVCLVVIAFVTLAAPVVAATTWRTKALVTSKGGSYVDTRAWVETVVNRPTAVRIGFATPAGAKTFKVHYSVFCDNSSTSRNVEITTPSDGSTHWITPFAGGGLGPYCEVSAWTRNFNGTDKVVVKVQAKHR